MFFKGKINYYFTFKAQWDFTFKAQWDLHSIHVEKPRILWLSNPRQLLWHNNFNCFGNIQSLNLMSIIIDILKVLVVVVFSIVTNPRQKPTNKINLLKVIVLHKIFISSWWMEKISLSVIKSSWSKEILLKSLYALRFGKSVYLRYYLHCDSICFYQKFVCFNSLSADPGKWTNTLKRFVGAGA